jgi:hypothetical protein
MTTARCRLCLATQLRVFAGCLALFMSVKLYVYDPSFAENVIAVDKAV